MLNFVQFIKFIAIKTIILHVIINVKKVEPLFFLLIVRINK